MCGLWSAGAFQRLKVDLLLPSSHSQLLLEHAAAAFPGLAARSRPFNPACCAEESSVRAYSRLSLPMLPVRTMRGREGEERAAPSSRCSAPSC